MNDLRELRETLRERADLHDTASATRAAAVHDRVRGVRRRRRGVVGGVAAAAVAVVAIGLNLPGSADRTEPADGLDAPETITSLGYTYELESTTTREHKVSVEVPKSDQPTLVAWGTEAGADDPVRVDANGGAPFTSADDAFHDFYLVHPGERAKILITKAEGEVSVATYSLVDAAPAGVTRDGSTFRNDVGVWDLAAAEIGDRGDHELTFDLTIPDSGLVRVADLCVGLPRGYWVSLAVDGKAFEFSDHVSCDDSGFDPAGGSWSITRTSALGKPGATVPVRMWVSRTMEGDEPVDPADLSDLRLGASFYALDPDHRDTSMNEPEALVESRGHTWRQVYRFGGSGTSPMTQRLAGDKAHLVMVNYRTTRLTTYRISADGRELDSRRYSGGRPAQGGFGEIMVPPGAKQLTVEVTDGGTQRTQTTVGVYERVD